MDNKYTIKGHCYKVSMMDNHKFAAMAMWENESHIGFESKKGSKTILNKSLILELYDLGLPNLKAVV